MRLFDAQWIQSVIRKRFTTQFRCFDPYSVLDFLKYQLARVVNDPYSARLPELQRVSLSCHCFLCPGVGCTRGVDVVYYSSNKLFFQFVREPEVSIDELTGVCSELVERWDDVSLYFGTHRLTAASEVRSHPKFEIHAFEDRLSRPRFAVLKWLLSISEWFCLLDFCGITCG